jgi:DNA primase
MIPNEIILQIQNAADIVEIIREHVPDLKRAGREFVALCPFPDHNEKTPSFKVNAEKRIFKCFGCGKAGNVFRFLQYKEGVTFPESVRMLGRRYGIRVPEGTHRSKEESDRISRLYEANEVAADFFCQVLDSGAGDAARAYLGKRGLKKDTIKTFRIGFAPNEWDGLVRFAPDRKASLRDLETIGLVKMRKSGGGYYDYFRGRLMFPILDTFNRVVAFGGRFLEGVTDERGSTGKYINSPESLIFSKSRVLYGLNLARTHITAARTVAVVEGYTDVIKAHEAGVKNVVAAMGTAFTSNHARTLKRLESKVVLVFDADEAGLIAARRTLPLLLKEDMDLAVARLPGGKDPFDVIREDGAEAFQRAIDGASDVIAFLADALGSATDLNSPDARSRVIDQLLELVAVIPNHVRRDLWLTSIASKFEVSEDAVRKRLGDLTKPARPSGERIKQPEPLKDADPLEVALLELALAEPGVAAGIFETVSPANFTNADLHRIAEAANGLLEESGDFRLDELTISLEDERLEIVAIDLAGSCPDHSDFEAAAS